MMNAATCTDEDLFSPAEPLAPVSAEGFVLGEFAGLCIAIPQADVLTIEHGSELSAPLPGEPVIGWFNGAQGPWPVYALDADLRSTTSATSGSFLVFLRSQPWPAGLLCERVRIVRSRSELSVQALPTVMQDAAKVIGGMARIDKSQLAWVVREGQLAAHLTAISEREVGRE